MSVGAARDVACGECGAPMVLKTAALYGPFYGCSRWPDCVGAHGAHPDGSPLGIPADGRTRYLRQLAHAAFDAAWHKRGLKRHEAYRWLQALTGKNSDEAHIARFNADECRTLMNTLLNAAKD